MRTEKYVVTYKTEIGGIGCQIMTGQKLAEMYGFSGCSGDEVLFVYRVLEGGNLWKCDFHGSWKAPFNRLVVNRGLYDTVEYEWPEH